MTEHPLEELVRFEEAVRALIQGEHLGIKTGSGGLEFDHLKQWEPGDSFRDINKVASYRYRDVLVNARLPDREIEVVFVLDMSRSMFFGSREETKIERVWGFLKRAIELSEESRPFFSIGYTSKTGPRFLSLGMGESARTQLQKTEEIEEVDTGHFFPHPLLRSLRKRGAGRTYIVLIFSDFADVDVDYQNELRALTRAGHKVCGIAVLDKFEVAMPSVPLGALSLSDVETGAHFLARGSRDFLSPHMGVFSAAHGQFAVFDETEKEEM